MAGCWVAVFAGAALMLVGADAARILAIGTVPSHSHHLWMSRYLEALVERGHHVTYFGVDEYKNPPKNLRPALAEDVYASVYAEIDVGAFASIGPFISTKLLYMWDVTTTESIVKSKGFQEFLKIVRTEKFDLIVYDVVSSAFLLGASEPLGYPPIIGVTAFGVPPYSHQMTGNPIPFTSTPHYFLQFNNRMTLIERIENFLLHLYDQYERHWYIKNNDEVAKTQFGKSTKHINEIMDSINIVMVNAHAGADFPYAAVPGLVNIGGMHIQPPKPLPEDLKKLLDEAPQGVMYFSLGSNIMSSDLKRDTVDILLEAFKRLSPLKVLWKWEKDDLPGKPENVEIRKWLPQNDILAHPNVKLFFTHAGLLSTQEATYHGVPVVGMPFFLDQHVNIGKCIRRGVGEQLLVTSLTPDNIFSTIKKVLDSTKYRDNMKALSATFRDGLNKPTDIAIFWTEYALRHKGAPQLRPASRDLSWHQTWLLDVIFVVFVLPVFVLYLTVKLVWKLFQSGKKKIKTN